VSEAFLFGPFRLIADRRELLVHGVPVTLGQRAFDVLLALVRRHGELATKDELMAEVWRGVIVEENSLHVHVSTLRKVLGAAGDGQRYLVTVAGRGYRFVAPVECKSDGNDAHADGRVPAVPILARGNLPQQLTSLIGQEATLAEIRARLATRRLVSLTGSGGVGKTRLAIEAGNMLLGEYGDGVWLAELAPLQDRQLVTAVVADALGVSLADQQGAMATLISALKPKHLLLIIDNCEHVIAEVARLVETLLRQCARLSILASSRERLAVSAEYVIRVPSLAVPEAGTALTPARARESAAVRLFEDRADTLGHGFTLDPGNVEAVAAICRRLDGIPLAIELAVPRLRIMSVQQLERALDEPFAILTSGSRTALPRQRTLQALIDWSYDLLTDPEKRLLICLSAFLGSTSLESIATIAASVNVPSNAVADLLLSLAEKSLVHAEPGNESRYRLPESIRLYARGKPEFGTVQARLHAEHFVVRFANATAAWETTPTREWLDRYADDVDNLRAALRWAFSPDGDDALGIDLVGQSHVMWAELGLILEHRRWVVEALSKSKATSCGAMARLLAWQAGDVRQLDDPADIKEALQAATIFRTLGDAFQEGRVLLRAGTAMLSPDNIDEGERTLCEALALIRPAGSTKTLARCLGALASARLFAGDLKQARSLHEQAIRTYCKVGENLESTE
jgi:predicted ATPase/DNA-binding winged helix-turn-helix (wHTH) protein